MFPLAGCLSVVDSIKHITKPRTSTSILHPPDLPMCIYLFTPRLCRQCKFRPGFDRLICKLNMTKDDRHCPPDIPCTTIQFQIDPAFVGTFGVDDMACFRSDLCLDCTQANTAKSAKHRIEWLEREVRRHAALVSKANDIISQGQADSMIFAGLDATGTRQNMLRDWKVAIQAFEDMFNPEGEH